MTQTIEVPAPEGASTTPAPKVRGRWALSWHGVRTVAALELRQRVRSTRWIVALVVWTVVVGAITLLMFGALDALFGGIDDVESDNSGRGPLLFAAVTFLVLGLGLLVTPTLSSTSVNGDRNAGTLATLQVTLLSPAEIALGKLLAAWAASCAFLVLSVPFLAMATAAGPTPWWSLLRVVLLIAVLLVAVCAIGLGMSALVSRTAGSTVLTFIVVAAVTFIAPLMFGLTYSAVSSHETVRVYGMPSSWNGDTAVQCVWTEEERPIAHTELTWGLLAVNPFVIVADGAGTGDVDSSSSDALGGLRDVVRQVRAGANGQVDECWADDDEFEAARSDDPVWPWGLGLNVLLGAAGYVVAVRRLSVPQRTLPRGTRVA
ncbi:MAG: ABC transporter permease [Cellulomonas sp.]|uniref:ABC transporter permease n=1 Tax=Cellulomonas gelida TaxID=1712 RepID=A0A4Y3KSV4_9CELL|nr:MULTISPECIES: ABC transporter permease subunit [Cellulomonas]MCR6648704.1 ABC transporter permease [Cellulomonas sp.]GEA85938.1 ABC transporter permease [Cellulomonas gelida]GGL33646.1 ABC transporter permease [Cellulomonas gelida]